MTTEDKTDKISCLCQRATAKLILYLINDEIMSNAEKFKCNAKFKQTVEENVIFNCVYTVFKAKTLSKLGKIG